MSKHSTCAGIDTSKSWLDVRLNRGCGQLEVENAEGAFVKLSGWLREHGVKRVGIEASGGYEKAVVAWLRRDGFEVVVWQPAQIRAFARFCLQRAKNDDIDAHLIAVCTAAVDKLHPAPDPRLTSLAEHLTLIDQIGTEIVRFKNYLEAPCEDPRGRDFWKEEIKRFERLKKDQLKQMVAAIRKHHDLAERLDLITSIEGIGLPTAVAILVRMPEIGRITREQAAALVGVAPYDNDSGEHRGARRIWGGRHRLRKALYAAALAASTHWNPQLIALYKRLIAAGKCHKAALVACARKMIVFVNAVVARGTPWTAQGVAT
jgi:transposase